MNLKYDDKLLALTWFQSHKQLLPFVGDQFEEHKILQIGKNKTAERETLKGF